MASSPTFEMQKTSFELVAVKVRCSEKPHHVCPKLKTRQLIGVYKNLQYTINNSKQRKPYFCAKTGYVYQKKSTVTRCFVIDKFLLLKLFRKGNVRILRLQSIFAFPLHNFPALFRIFQNLLC